MSYEKVVVFKENFANKEGGCFYFGTNTTIEFLIKNIIFDSC